MVNGALTRYLDFMDVYWSKDICHPSENIPVALALTQARRGSGKQLIEAIVIGYEAQLRLCDTINLRDLGLHHATAAGFVVPLMAGKIWGLDITQTAHACALGGARHLTVGAMSRGRLSMAKAIGYPMSAMETLFSTRLAIHLLHGPPQALGFLLHGMPSRHPLPESAALDLKRAAYVLERVSLKRFPVQFELQGPVEIAARLHRALKVNGGVAAIESIVIEVLPLAKERTADAAKFRPANRETADHSLPCCVAMALIDGELTPHQFEADRWRDADVAELMAKIQVEPSADFERRLRSGRPAAIALKLRDRTTLREVEEVPPGDAARPLDDAALEQKFRSLAEPALGAVRSGEVLRCVARLDQLEDVAELMVLLKSAP